MNKIFMCLLFSISPWLLKYLKIYFILAPVVVVVSTAYNSASINVSDVPNATSYDIVYIAQHDASDTGQFNVISSANETIKVGLKTL